MAKNISRHIPSAWISHYEQHVWWWALARTSLQACDPPISWPDAEGVFWKQCCCQSQGSSGIEPVGSLYPSSCYLSDDWLTALTHICLAWTRPNIVPIALIMPMNYSCLLQKGRIWRVWAKSVAGIASLRKSLSKYALCGHCRVTEINNSCFV